MTDSPISNEKREFRCVHCDGLIRIPRELPPTTGPCPHCSGIITSPAPPPADLMPMQEPSAVVAEALLDAPLLPTLTTPLPIAAPPLLEIPSLSADLPSPAVADDIPPEIPRSPSAPEEFPSLAAAEEMPPEPPAPASPSRSGLIPLMLVLLVLGTILLGAVFYLVQELGKNIAPPTPNPLPGAASPVGDPPNP